MCSMTRLRNNTQELHLYLKYCSSTVTCPLHPVFFVFWNAISVCSLYSLHRPRSLLLKPDRKRPRTQPNMPYNNACDFELDVV